MQKIIKHLEADPVVEVGSYCGFCYCMLATVGSCWWAVTAPDRRVPDLIYLRIQSR